jgi:hypothetical protein
VGDTQVMYIATGDNTVGINGVVQCLRRAMHMLLTEMSYHTSL